MIRATDKILLPVVSKFVAVAVFLVLVTNADTAQAQSDSDQPGFTIGPAPVARALLPGERTNRIDLGLVNIAVIGDGESGGLDIELDNFQLAFTNRRRGDGRSWLGQRYTFYVNAGNGIGDQDTATFMSTIELDTYNFGTQFDLELYPNIRGSTAFFLGFKVELGEQTFEQSFSDNTFSNDSVSVSSVFTYALRAGLQKRIALGANFGLTPFFVASNTLTSITPDEPTADITDISFVSTTFGLDIDYKGVSLTAFYQDSDDVEITALSIGFNF